MDWYYSDGKTPFGPISDDEFEILVNEGTIDTNTLVWHQGMQTWQKYETLNQEFNENEQKPSSINSEQPKKHSKKLIWFMVALVFLIVLGSMIYGGIIIYKYLMIAPVINNNVQNLSDFTNSNVGNTNTNNIQEQISTNLNMLGLENITSQVIMNDDGFNPETIIINKGDTIVWINKGSKQHGFSYSITDESGTQSSTSGPLDPGMVFGETFFESKIINYTDITDSSIKGQIIVQ